jgi:hypothetical protein
MLPAVVQTKCGAQGTGGSFTDREESAAGWENTGFPVAEVSADRYFVLTKPPGTGKVVSPLSVGEQLLCGIGDPATHVLSDVICGFTGVTRTQDGEQRVAAHGPRGRTGMKRPQSATIPGRIMTGHS